MFKEIEEKVEFYESEIDDYGNHYDPYEVDNELQSTLNKEIETGFESLTKEQKQKYIEIKDRIDDITYELWSV